MSNAQLCMTDDLRLPSLPPPTRCSTARGGQRRRRRRRRRRRSSTCLDCSASRVSRCGCHPSSPLLPSHPHPLHTTRSTLVHTHIHIQGLRRCLSQPPPCRRGAPSAASALSYSAQSSRQPSSRSVRYPRLPAAHPTSRRPSCSGAAAQCRHTAPSPLCTRPTPSSSAPRLAQAGRLQQSRPSCGCSLNPPLSALFPSALGRRSLVRVHIADRRQR